MVFTYKNEIILFKLQKSTENINSRVSKISNNRTVVLLKCAKLEVKNQDSLKIKEQKDYWVI